MRIPTLSGLILITFLCTAGGAFGVPVLSIDGPSSVNQGDTGVTFTVRLDDTSPMDVAQADVFIIFDGGVFQFPIDVPGTLVSLNNTDPLFDDIFSASVDTASDPGTIAISLTKSPFVPITASGSLLIVEFAILSDASADLTFTFDNGLTKLFDSSFAEVNYVASDFPLTIDPAAAPLPAPWALLPLGLIVMRRLGGKHRSGAAPAYPEVLQEARRA